MLLGRRSKVLQELGRVRCEEGSRRENLMGPEGCSHKHAHWIHDAMRTFLVNVRCVFLSRINFHSNFHPKTHATHFPSVVVMLDKPDPKCPRSASLWRDQCCPGLSGSQTAHGNMSLIFMQ